MGHYHESSFTVREPAWHGLSTVFDTYPTSWDQAREWAGLEWEPTDEPVYRKEILVQDGAPVERFVEVPNFKLISRDDNGNVLDIEKDSFELIFHKQMGELVEAFMGEANIKFETAGSLRGGASVWALARLDEPFQVPGDNSPTYPYVALLNSHDGTGACKITRTNVRVVCWNTFSMADMQGDSRGGTDQIILRHTKGVAGRIEEAKLAIRAMRDEAAAWQVLAGQLIDISAPLEMQMDFINEFVPMPPEGVISDRVARNVTEARDAIWQVLHSNTINEEIRGTGYALVQAAGEYLDHLRGYRNKETYLGRTLLKPERLKGIATRKVFELAGVAHS